MLREIRKAVPRFAGRRIEVTVQRRVAEQLLGPGQESLRALEAELGREVEIRVRPDIHQEQFEIRADGEGGRVTLAPALAAERQAGRRPPEEAAEAVPQRCRSRGGRPGRPDGAPRGAPASESAAGPRGGAASG